MKRLALFTTICFFLAGFSLAWAECIGGDIDKRQCGYRITDTPKELNDLPGHYKTAVGIHPSTTVTLRKFCGPDHFATTKTREEWVRYYNWYVNDHIPGCGGGCIPNTSLGCYNGDIYNYDSCGNRGSLEENCAVDCASGDTSCPPIPDLCGDANIDGSITGADGSIIYNHVTGSTTLTGQPFINAACASADTSVITCSDRDAVTHCVLNGGNPTAGCYDTFTPTSCSDGTMNGCEIGGDCGGPECVACGSVPVGDACTHDNMCTTGCCSDSTGLCELCPCENGIEDGDEEGVDCGGSCPTACPSGPCSNGVKDPGEDGIDCGPACGSCCANFKKQCDGDDMYFYDSCGNQESLISNCITYETIVYNFGGLPATSSTPVDGCYNTSSTTASCCDYSDMLQARQVGSCGEPCPAASYSTGDPLQCDHDSECHLMGGNNAACTDRFYECVFKGHTYQNCDTCNNSTCESDEKPYFSSGSMRSPCPIDCSCGNGICESEDEVGVVDSFYSPDFPTNYCGSDCSACGNGICEPGKFENSDNCLDCRTAIGGSCSSNVDCGSKYCAIHSQTSVGKCETTTSCTTGNDCGGWNLCVEGSCVADCTVENEECSDDSSSYTTGGTCLRTSGASSWQYCVEDNSITSGNKCNLDEQCTSGVCSSGLCT